MPIVDPMRILTPIEVDGNITHWSDGRYSGNPAPVVVATAGQALTAGQFVCVKWIAGPNNYQAWIASSNQTSTWACGYVINDVMANGSAFVHYGGINDKAIIANPSGTSVGAVWLGPNGTATLTPPPEALMTVSQRIGTLVNQNRILFAPESPIRLQNAIAGTKLPVVYDAALGMLREVSPLDTMPPNVGGGGDGTPGVTPAPGRFSPLWGTPSSEVSQFYMAAGVIVAARMKAGVTFDQISVYVESVQDVSASIEVAIYDDGQYPYPGALLTSTQFADVTDATQYDFAATQSPGTYWLAVQNIGTTDITMRSTLAFNPYSPGVRLFSSFGMGESNAEMLYGQGSSVPSLWPTGAGFDGPSCLFVIRGA